MEKAQMERILKPFNEMLEELRPAFEAARETISVVVETLRRYYLYAKLIRWHFPNRVAKFIANRWPKRWLPTMGDWGG